MKNLVLYIVGAIILLLGGFFIVSRNSQLKTASMEVSDEKGEIAEYVVEEKDMTANQQFVATEQIEMARYVEYTRSGFDAAKDKKKVYFFHAKWCETCFAANKEFTEEHNKIPTDVMLFKTDYDTEKELKKQYSITYQHTFVYVDKDGKQIKKWSGGAIDDLIANTK